MAESITCPGHQLDNSINRRGFLKVALLGGVATGGAVVVKAVEPWVGVLRNATSISVDPIEDPNQSQIHDQDVEVSDGKEVKAAKFSTVNASPIKGLNQSNVTNGEDQFFTVSDGQEIPFQAEDRFGNPADCVAKGVKNEAKVACFDQNGNPVEFGNVYPEGNTVLVDQK